jgi:uncharacterized protein (TIGR02145 family)
MIMNPVNQLIAGTILIALTLTFAACGKHDLYGDTHESSSSSAGNSSSEAMPSSSSNTPSSSAASSSSNSQSSSSSAISSSSVGEVYETVDIGSRFPQTWLKRNLNVMPRSGNSWCYENKESNCEKYGRLYDWAAAMNLPDECNEISCAERIENPHQGICPDGFHIPTNAEWDILYRLVGGASCNINVSPCQSQTAGKYLKAQEGWADCGPSGSGKTDLCDDAYGFSALPGGTRLCCHNLGLFGYATYHGYWWSSEESSSGNAYYRFLYFDADAAFWGGIKKESGYSVRCLKDEIKPPPSSSSAVNVNLDELTSIGRATVTDQKDCKIATCLYEPNKPPCVPPPPVCTIIAENEVLTHGGKKPCPNEKLYIVANNGDILEFTIGNEITSCDSIANNNLTLQFTEPPCNNEEWKAVCKIGE